jgi:hypothetical protein
VFEGFATPRGWQYRQAGYASSRAHNNNDTNTNIIIITTTMSSNYVRVEHRDCVRRDSLTLENLTEELRGNGSGQHVSFVSSASSQHCMTCLNNTSECTSDVALCLRSSPETSDQTRGHTQQGFQEGPQHQHQHSPAKRESASLFLASSRAL